MTGIQLTIQVLTCSALVGLLLGVGLRLTVDEVKAALGGCRLTVILLVNFLAIPLMTVGFAIAVLAPDPLTLFILLIPFTGLSISTSLIGLTIYTLLILVRNIVEGLRGVDRDVREAAEAMGYTRARQLFQVELPLALPVIIAGVRIATVTTIGLVTVTALIGWGGLGRLFIDGFTLNFTTPIVVGIVLSALLAFAADLFLVGLQHWLTPWARSGGS